MIGVCGDKFTQSADGLLVVAFDEVLRFELQQFPIPVAAVIEGLARVQNDLLFLKETSAVQQQTHVEVRVLSVEKLLQQRQCVGSASRLKQKLAEEIREGLAVRRAATRDRLV